MNDEPRVTIESETPSRRHWFQTAFYRKDGAKFTLIPQRARAAVGGFFLVGYACYVFQGPPPEHSERMTQIARVAESASESPNQDLPKPDANEKKKSPKTTNRKTTRPSAQSLGPVVVTRPKVPIPPGTIVKGKLLTGGSNGPVRAELTVPLDVGGEVTLEPGNILLGTGSSTEERLLIRFNRLVFKDGTSQSVEAQAFDPEDKTAGLKGSLLGNRAIKVAGSIGLTFVGGVSDGLQETQTQGGTSFRPSTLKNALLNGASYAAIEESRDQMSQLKNQVPVIHVEAGKEILISFGDSGQ